MERSVRLQCAVLAADAIERGDERNQRVRRIAVALPDFVFFAVEIFL